MFLICDFCIPLLLYLLFFVYKSISINLEQFIIFNASHLLIPFSQKLADELDFLKKYIFFQDLYNGKVRAHKNYIPTYYNMLV